MFDDEVSRILVSDKFQRPLRAMLPRTVAVEEVLGRTWERARDNMPTYGDHAAWLRRVAVNIAKDDVKAETRRKRRERHMATDDGSDGTARSHYPSSRGDHKSETNQRTTRGPAPRSSVASCVGRSSTPCVGRACHEIIAARCGPGCETALASGPQSARFPRRPLACGRSALGRNCGLTWSPPASSRLGT